MNRLHVTAIYVGIAATLSVVSMGAANDISAPGTIPISWSSKEYVAQLPLPHGKTIVRVCLEDTGKLAGIYIRSNVDEWNISTGIEELRDLGEPDIAILSDGSGNDSRSFVVSFEFGTPYKIATVSCKETGLTCNDWVKDIVSFEVDSTGQIRRRIYEVGERIGKSEK